METLTLTLHKSKETKNKVVYATRDGSVIQGVYIDKDAWAAPRQLRSRWSYHRSKQLGPPFPQDDCKLGSSIASRSS